MRLTIVEPSFEIITPLGVEQLKFLELCARVCYKSEERITDNSASKLVRRLRESKHESILEHVSATVRIIGSRSMSHQLVRHRIGVAYAQESQRFCNYGKKGFQFICPPAIGLPAGTYGYPYQKNLTDQQLYWLACRINECCEYMELIEGGVRPEDARECLPNAIKTEVMTTCNLRAWRHMFSERALNPHAQWQIRNIMCGILCKFGEMLPEVFGDQLLDYEKGL